MYPILIGLLAVELALGTWAFQGWSLSMTRTCAPLKARFLLATLGSVWGHDHSMVAREHIFSVGADAHCWRAHPLSGVSVHGPIGQDRVWDPLLRQASQVTGIPAPLLKAMMLTESNGNPRARSNKGALGLMQMLPSTAVQLGARTLQELYDPPTNVLLGSTYMRQLLDEFDGNVPLALAAYNAGPNYIRSGRPWPAETREYVSRVLALL